MRQLLLILPLKLSLLLLTVYVGSHLTDTYKKVFPDKWADISQNQEKENKLKKTFLFIPYKIEGKWYVFQYVYSTEIGDVTYLSIEPINQDSDKPED